MSPQRIEVVHKVYPITLGEGCKLVDWTILETALVALIDHSEPCRCSGLRTLEETVRAESEYAQKILYSGAPGSSYCACFGDGDASLPMSET